MTSFISHTTIDCRNAYELSEWWKQVLEYVDDPDDPNEPGHDECWIQRPDGGHPLLFIEVPEGKQVKNRIHFDLRPSAGSRDEELQRLLDLGARRSTTSATTTAPAGSCWPTPRTTSSASCAARKRSTPARPTSTTAARHLGLRWLPLSHSLRRRSAPNAPRRRSCRKRRRRRSRATERCERQWVVAADHLGSGVPAPRRLGQVVHPLSDRLGAVRACPCACTT